MELVLRVIKMFKWRNFLMLSMKLLESTPSMELVDPLTEQTTIVHLPTRELTQISLEVLQFLEGRWVKGINLPKTLIRKKE